MASNNFHILVTAGGVPKQAVDFLKSQGCSVDQWHLETAMPRDELLKRAKNVDAIYCTVTDQIDEEVVAAAGSKLKVVGTMSVGVDHVDKGALKTRGIRLGNTPDVLTDACAELIICLITVTMRKIVEGALAAKNGGWTDAWRPLWLCGSTIYGSTLGFVGFGRIGQAVAMRLKAFNPAKMLYYSQSRKSVGLEKEHGVDWCANLDQLMSSVDVVIVCCALNKETRHLMSKEKLSLTKRGSFFINASRGPVVDQDALVELLKEGHFGGVGLDVTTPEPLPTSHALFSFPECTIFPHMGSSSVQTRMRMAQMTSENIVAALTGAEMPAELK